MLLAAFADKGRQRVCRRLSSPTDSGSNGKSASLDELEIHHKPEWIRADAVPTLDVVEKQKQRIADLEENLKKRKTSPQKWFAGSRGYLRNLVHFAKFPGNLPRLDYTIWPDGKPCVCEFEVIPNSCCVHFPFLRARSLYPVALDLGIKN
jgi:hypothetical protein